MKNLKIIICLIVVALFSLSLVACGNSGSQNDPADPTSAVEATEGESKAESDAANSVEVDTKADETAESQIVDAPHTEEGDLEIMTAPVQSEAENQKTDSAQEQTNADTQPATEASDVETNPQAETYIELPFIPAE